MRDSADNFHSKVPSQQNMWSNDLHVHFLQVKHLNGLFPLRFFRRVPTGRIPFVSFVSVTRWKSGYGFSAFPRPSQKMESKVLADQPVFLWILLRMSTALVRYLMELFTFEVTDAPSMSRMATKASDGETFGDGDATDSASVARSSAF